MSAFTAALLAVAVQQIPVFRSGTNLVQVDAIVTNDENDAVLDLTERDFTILDDGKPMEVKSVRLIRAASELRGPFAPIRTVDDEAREAARDEVRVFAILLDDYHVARGQELSVKEPLRAFVENLPPTDLVGVYSLFDSIRDAHLTRDRGPALKAIANFYGRRGDYTPKYPVEEEHWKRLRDIERIRADIFRGALEALAIHLGGLKEGRKTLIFVSAGTGMEEADIRQIEDAANRANVALYPLDPSGLTVRRPSGAFQSPLEILQRLALTTGGRAIVQTNEIGRALASINRESSAYYLLAYESPHPSDGKTHSISVKVQRRGVHVRARTAYHAFKDRETTAAAPAQETTPAVTAALGALADSLRPDSNEPAEPRRRLGTAEPVKPPIDLIGVPELLFARGTEPGVSQPRREFLRAGVLVVRAAVAGAPQVAARLLSQTGAPLTALPITCAEATCTLRLPLPGLGPGDYLVELTAVAEGRTRQQIVGFRVVR